MHYIATARAYCFDLAAMAFLFVSASVMAGRVWRFPFDDEIATLSKIEADAARELLANFPATDDIHPPFSYLIFLGLRQLGLSDAGMRLCSLFMTWAALALCQILVLNWLSWRTDGEKLPSPTRIVAVVIFGLMPLAVSQGDALRWYPVFTVLMTLFVVTFRTKQYLILLIAMPTAARLSSRPIPSCHGSCGGPKAAVPAISSMCGTVCSPAAVTIPSSSCSDTMTDPATRLSCTNSKYLSTRLRQEG